MFYPKDLAAQYLRKHGYDIVDRGVLPFKHGITTIDFVVYEKAENTLVAVCVYATDDSYDNAMAEWRHKDSSYFRRAIRRYDEKRGWRGKTRADLILVRGDDCIMHVIGETKVRKTKGAKHEQVK